MAAGYPRRETLVGSATTAAQMPAGISGLLRTSSRAASPAACSPAARRCRHRPRPVPGIAAVPWACSVGDVRSENSPRRFRASAWPSRLPGSLNRPGPAGGWQRPPGSPRSLLHAAGAGWLERSALARVGSCGDPVSARLAVSRCAGMVSAGSQLAGLPCSTEVAQRCLTPLTGRPRWLCRFGKCAGRTPGYMIGARL